MTLLLLAGPVLAGLAGTVLPALGWLPALGGDRFSLQPWSDLLATPGLVRSAGLSLWTGLAATALAVALVILIASTFEGTRAFRLIESVLSPLLSVPHAAAAFGLAFLIAPSGWLSRMISPWLTGWRSPPDWLVVNDPLGFALIAGLVMKEVPFLMLMTLAALPQADAVRTRKLALALGYAPVAAWIKCVLPRVYPQIRLPVLAVLAYAISTVEMAVILGPTTPALLAVRLTTWMQDPDLAMWFKASAGALLQLGLALCAVGLWRAGERAAAWAGPLWIERGGRGAFDRAWRVLGGVAAGLATVPILLGLASLVVWSVAGLWPFPDALPRSLITRTWAAALPGVMAATGASVLIAISAVAVSLVLVLASLEAGSRHARRGDGRALLVLYLPLVVPQVAFLFGLQTLTLALGVDGRMLGVIAVHVVFVLPYVYLSLADPWRSLDPRFAIVGASLGAAPNRVFWRLRLPLLLAPVLTAAAVGFAVSIGLYLPTLLIGGGRIATLTTEAVALAAGGDRRLIGVYALIQMLLPFGGFAVALAVPALVWRRRAALRSPR